MPLMYLIMYLTMQSQMGASQGSSIDGKEIHCLCVNMITEYYKAVQDQEVIRSVDYCAVPALRQNAWRQAFDWDIVMKPTCFSPKGSNIEDKEQFSWI